MADKEEIKEKEGAKKQAADRQRGKGKPSARHQQPEHKGAKSTNAIVRYFQDTGEELRKVTWPDREETTRLSLIVLGVTVASALVLGLLDLLFQELMALLV
ncbi:MAG: hypothetical protein Kow00124_17670 [Anaerolineae bacterium]